MIFPTLKISLNLRLFLKPAPIEICKISFTRTWFQVSISFLPVAGFSASFPFNRKLVTSYGENAATQADGVFIIITIFVQLSFAEAVWPSDGPVQHHNRQHVVERWDV